MAKSGTQTRSRVFARLRAASDRVPTAWFATIGTGLFLAVTAAFGGLNDVPPTPIVTVAAEEAHESDLLSVTVEQAFLFDALPDARVPAQEGTDVLALRVTMENLSDAPVTVAPGSVAADTVSITVDGAKAEAVALLVDGTQNPVLQPGLPMQLALVWRVPSGAVDPTVDLTVDLSDPTLFVGTGLTRGEQWNDGDVTAVVHLPLTDQRGTP